MPDPTQTPNMPEASTPGEYNCKCPNCGQDIKLSLSKAQPAMPAKPSGMPQMSASENSGPDMASMIDESASKY